MQPTWKRPAWKRGTLPTPDYEFRHEPIAGGTAANARHAELLEQGWEPCGQVLVAGTAELQYRRVRAAGRRG